MSAVRVVAILAQRYRWEAYVAAVALDSLVPRAGRTWRAVCCLCADSLDVAGTGVDAHRINTDTGHDTGCCAFCGTCGRDTLVASVPDDAFALPPVAFLELRRAYVDHGGLLTDSYPTAT